MSKRKSTNDGYRPLGYFNEGYQPIQRPTPLPDLTRGHQPQPIQGNANATPPRSGSAIKRPNRSN